MASVDKNWKRDLKRLINKYSSNKVRKLEAEAPKSPEEDDPSWKDLGNGARMRVQAQYDDDGNPIFQSNIDPVSKTDPDLTPDQVEEFLEWLKEDDDDDD